MTHTKQFTIVLMLLLMPLTNIFAQYFSGFTKPKMVNINSKHTKSQQKYWIALPNDYKDSPKVQYSVIYLFDADNTDLSKMTMNLLNYLAKNGPEIPPVIIVGVLQKDRVKDFMLNTLYKSTSSDFQLFLTKELQPHINLNYRTNSHNIAVGHSMGGAFCFLLAIKFPDSFSSFIAISPAMHNWEESVWKNSLQNYLKTNLWNKFYVLYSNYGTFETALYPHTKKFEQFIDETTNQQLKERTYFQYVGNISHNVTPILAISSGLSFIFKEWKMKITDLKKVEKGELSVQAYIEERKTLLKATYNYQYHPMAEEVNFYYKAAKKEEDKIFVKTIANQLYSKKYVAKMLR